MICADKGITIYHFDKDEVTKEYFSNVSVFAEIKANISGIDNYSSSEIIIRIPTEKVNVEIGDKIVLRKVEEEEIPYNEAFTVYSIKNNVRGSRRMHHICLKCR